MQTSCRDTFWIIIGFHFYLSTISISISISIDIDIDIVLKCEEMCKVRIFTSQCTTLLPQIDLFDLLKAGIDF